MPTLGYLVSLCSTANHAPVTNPTWGIPNATNDNHDKNKRPEFHTMKKNRSKCASRGNAICSCSRRFEESERGCTGLMPWECLSVSIVVSCGRVELMGDGG